MKFTKVLVVFVLSVFWGLSALAQQSGTPVEVSANSLQAGTYNGQPIRRLLGNVVMKQGATTVTSDSAYQYAQDRNRLEVFSNVVITQETMHATSNTASYDGTKRIADMRGNVVLRDQDMTLTTPTLNYDLDAKRAYYTQSGNIVGPDYTIVSQYGTYTTANKVLSFKKNVVYKGQNAEVLSDTMAYNTVSKIVEFFGPTTIKSPDGILFANRGTYNTVTRESNFRGNASIKTPDYLIKGDVLTYDKTREYYTATRNVSMTSIKENTIITGQTAKYWRALGRAKVYGSPVMRSISAKDTMYLSADTLYSVEHVTDKTKKGMLYAYPDVRIFKSDLQGLSDSLTYNLDDSTIYLNKSPRLWASKNQLTADSMILRLQGNSLRQMQMFGNSFAIAQDTLDNFNQIKGRNMTAHFAEGKINRIDVNGNGESLYFALQGDTISLGMNRVFCSDMRMLFLNGQVQFITFINEPDAKLIPPHELEEPDTRLRGFIWRADEKPSLQTVLAPRTAVKPANKTAPAGGVTNGIDVRRPGSAKPKPKQTSPAKKPAEKEKPVPRRGGAGFKKSF